MMAVKDREVMIGTKTERWAKGRALTMGLLVAALMAACVLLAANPAHASTFTVNSTGDAADNDRGDGSCFTGVFIQVGPGFAQECTLRAAIEETNDNDNNATVVDAIDFSISGSGPHTISPATTLPTITEPVVIDGYTEPGASENTLAVGDDADLRIRLNRGSANAPSGLVVETDGSMVRGLAITGFSSGVGIIVRGDDNTVEGNFIGTDPSGTREGLGNFTGVSVQDNSSGNIIGGTSLEARNIISGNLREGLLISTNHPSETGNKVQGNYIGTTSSGSADLGNEGPGVLVDTSENVIGGVTRGAANTIAFNGGDGVQVGNNFTPKAITVLRNSIYNNGDLGIDLDGDGITPNDGVGDPDTGPNNLQNFPTITSTRTGRRATTIKGTLGSTQNATFTIQFFSNPRSTKEEGKKFIGQKSVTTDAAGNAAFTLKPQKKVKEGLFVTATATNVATGGDTSEFSAPKKVRG